MLTGVLAHAAGGASWSAWSTNPLLWLALLAPAVVYQQGRRPGAGRHPARALAFGAGLLAIGVAVLSPLDALSAELAAVHMAQHLLLIIVGAPLIVLSAPTARLLRGLPRPLRHSVGPWRRRPAVRTGARWLDRVAVLAAVHAATVWIWHAPGPYEAALQHPPVHGLEHLTFLLTAALSWTAIFRAARGTSAGAGILVLFGLSVQGGLLGALLTFAPRPLYPSYSTTTSAWGLSPLADQQLAGVMMSVPAGLVYLVAGLGLLRAWLDPSPTPIAAHAGS